MAQSDLACGAPVAPALPRRAAPALLLAGFPMLLGLSSACHTAQAEFEPASEAPRASADAGPDDTDHRAPPDAPVAEAPGSHSGVTRPGPYLETRNIDFGGVEVKAIIDRPANDAADALLLFHGTVLEDRLVLDAARKTLEAFRALLDRDDLLLVSVAYPEEGRLMGDNVVHAEAALMWVRHHAEEALGVRIGRVFLAGHSQGGSIVTRLNTLHAVDGVIANAPGPLDLVFRCGLEEAGRIEAGVTCGLLAEAYGSTSESPEAYMARSLLAFTAGHRSDLLVVQGLDDSAIQLRAWPVFRQRLEACTNCRGREFLELEGLGHQGLFGSPAARTAFNAFLRRGAE